MGPRQFELPPKSEVVDSPGAYSIGLPLEDSFKLQSSINTAKTAAEDEHLCIVCISPNWDGGAMDRTIGLCFHRRIGCRRRQPRFRPASKPSANVHVLTDTSMRGTLF